jgi:F0F1-type ATP synthase alpha subunit
LSGKSNTVGVSIFERFGLGFQNECLMSHRMKSDPSGKRPRGLVTAIHDGIVTINFVADAKNGEILIIQSNSKQMTLKKKKYGFIKGMVCSVTPTKVDVVLFGDDRKIVEGDFVYRTGKLLNIPVGLQLFGKVVNSLGMPLDSKSWLFEFIRATTKKNRRKGALPSFSQRCLRYIVGSGRIEA